MSDRPYPTIKSGDELLDLPAVTYLEVAGRLGQIRLEDDDDPVEVARELMQRAPWENRFRIVRIQRFSLPTDPGWTQAGAAVGPQCGAMDSLTDGVVRCELEAHGDGIDHAGRILRDGRAAGVHYWRSKPAHTP
ncbi:hypothetical protein ACIBJF_32780 [Streptomyces sp. NPDC050743]|uniref:hypothetical protein n=1 Tax=Streptomyces sp. NPDC050743 TaxID=3365634 RepID=UPI0037A77694